MPEYIDNINDARGANNEPENEGMASRQIPFDIMAQVCSIEIPVAKKNEMQPKNLEQKVDDINSRKNQK